jgi:hypothetical protein
MPIDRLLKDKRTPEEIELLKWWLTGIAVRSLERSAHRMLGQSPRARSPLL